MHIVFGHRNIQVQFLNGSEHHQMGENACAYSHTEMRKKELYLYIQTHTLERMGEVSKNAPNLTKLKVINLLPPQL